MVSGALLDFNAGGSMKFLKKIFVLGLVGLAGWGIYSAGQNNLFAFLDRETEEQIRVVKKERAVKPESFFKQVRNVIPAPVREYDYTFLKTLEDVDMERYVDLDGKVKVMKKTVHSWVNEVGKVIHEPRVLLAAYKEPEKEAETSSSYEDIINKLNDLMKEEPKQKTAPQATPASSVKRSSPSATPSASTRQSVPSSSFKPYMIQVSSFRKLSHARALESKLQRKGYSAFVKSVELSKSKGTWYRVYLGKYQTEASARAAAREAQRLHNLKTLVLKARPR